jgi:hypothetical protein
VIGAVDGHPFQVAVGSDATVVKPWVPADPPSPAGYQHSGVP